jgi:hypothetical protein
MFITLAQTAHARAVAATLAGILALVLHVPASAGTIGGGGPRATDCLGVFATAADTPGDRPHIRCTDGDPTCDADLAVNGQCVFTVSTCANSTDLLQCTRVGVDSISIAHSADNGDPRFDPAFQAMQNVIDDLDFPTFTTDDCTIAINVPVILKGPFPGNRCRSQRKVIRMTTESTPFAGKRTIDRDALRLTCLPAADSCIPTNLYTGTFDRVQKQIFNQNCARSGCHDSQTQSNGLLLETGSSHTQLVGVTPTNAAAQGQGWNRITVLSPTLGDPDASYIYHKIRGDFPAGMGDFGGRMPLNRTPLPGFLIEVMRLWIEAGAPPAGWVPGTDS